MDSNYRLAAVIISLGVLAALLVLFMPSGVFLPNTCTVSFEADQSSNGVDRTVTAEISFVNGIVRSGWLKYVGEDVKTCIAEYELGAYGGVWIPKSSSACGGLNPWYGSLIPTAKVEIEKQINAGNMVPMGTPYDASNRLLVRYEVL